MSHIRSAQQHPGAGCGGITLTAGSISCPLPGMTGHDCTALFAIPSRPEDKAAKKQRLLAEAEAREKGTEADKKKPVVVKYGINHITTLVENGKAQVRLIPADTNNCHISWAPGCGRLNAGKEAPQLHARVTGQRNSVCKLLGC